LVDDADWPRPHDDDDDVVVLPLFDVDPDTGVVTAVAKLDRETSPQHRFQVRHVVTAIHGVAENHGPVCLRPSLSHFYACR